MTTSPGDIITPPQGGGALQGIGEKFSPDLFTGSGNFTVPLALPPGRNGFKPQLSLSYSTGNGNGPFGLGWALTVPGVSRKTSKGIPRYDDARDVFILSGAEDLVPVENPAAGVTRYQPRTEGLFARIKHFRIQHKVGGAQPWEENYWQVESKDGLVSVYGTPQPTAPPAAWWEPAGIVMPGKLDHLFAWKLTSTKDPFGNTILYEYVRDSSQTEGVHSWDQVYLSRIRYVDYGDSNNPSFLASVKFTYANRPDHFSDYRAGFEIRTIQRCMQIDISGGTDGQTPIRTYHLDYLDQDPSLAAQQPLNGSSVLHQVRVEGHDGANSEWLPPLEFGYTQFQPTDRKFIALGGSLPASSLGDKNLELVDLFGAGLPDILEMNGTVRYWRNTGEGQFALPHQMDEAPAGIGLADPGVQILDADGDARADLLVTTQAISGYYPLKFGGLFDGHSFQRYRVAPSFDLKDPEVRFVDLDGDGVTDAIRSSTRLECYFNDPEQGWVGTTRAERKTLDVFPDVDFADERVKWADMTGDGLQDVVLVHDGLVEYWPSLGRGNWGPRVEMPGPRFPWGYDPKRILLGDVDGDGAADLVYVDNMRVTLWINQGGNGWGLPISIEGTPPVSEMDSVRFADLLGNGVSGVLWSKNSNGVSRSNYFFLDFTGGVKPYLLHEMDNHMGSKTQVDYKPSTWYYLQDEQRLETRWVTPLPFPVQVVARVETRDQFSGGKLTTEYSYHHGYWDGHEREFRGFGRVDHRDTEVFSSATNVPPQYFSPPTETRTWFHQGAVGDKFDGWAESDSLRGQKNLTREYYLEPWPGQDPSAQVLFRPKAVSDYLAKLPSAVLRDALRSMRGNILRTELYALDGTERQNRPYTVTEHVCGVREVPRADSTLSSLHIFFPFSLSERTTQWERGHDPLSTFKFTDNCVQDPALANLQTKDYDSYGQPLNEINIAVPRGHVFQSAGASGQPYLATQTVTTYAQPYDAQIYIVDRSSSATTYEIVNDGSASIYDFVRQVQDAPPTGNVVSHNLSFYDGDPFQGLPFGQIGLHGALMRVESLVLTDDILKQAYGANIPPYLSHTGPPNWTSEYPQEFQKLLPALAGYVYHDPGAGSSYVQGYYRLADQRRYDFQEAKPPSSRGLLTAKHDALNNETTISYDAYAFLPITVTQVIPGGVGNAAGLSTQAAYDYRVFQPNLMTDVNGNQTAFTFSPLGLLATKAIRGKPGESKGDLARASAQLTYDFLAFVKNGQPILVHTIQYVHHDTEMDVPQPERDQTIEKIEYSDGLGRLLQARQQAEDVLFDSASPNNPIFGDAGLPANQSQPAGDAVGQQASAANPFVVVSGWQVYDNKGQVVEKFEPFFSTGWNFKEPLANQFGQKATLYYDPRGHVIRTVNPDGSEQRVVYGVPGTIAVPDWTNPDVFEPTPWEAYTYDANDNAGRTHPSTSTAYQQDWNTPSSIVNDALGRTVFAVARNRDKQADGSWSPIVEYTTRSTFDIRGNLLTVTDSLRRVAFTHAYDLANRALLFESIDAGSHLNVFDAANANNVVEQRDAKGSLTLHAYDALNRRIRGWARDASGQSVTLREKMIYGDDGSGSGLTAAQAILINLLGKPYEQYDEAGLVTFAAYDFKGNLLDKTRSVIGESNLLSIFTLPPANWNLTPFRVDWASAPAGLLDQVAYETTSTYDALNRIKTMQYPQDASGSRKLLTPSYNRAGALESVRMDGAIYVERIAYNAKGQRILISYVNGLMTRYAYDQRTFRLLHMRTERYAMPLPTPLTYRPSAPAAPLQEFAYEYDLVGNILMITDRTPGSGVLNNPQAAHVSDPTLAQLLISGNAMLRNFEYDSVYRLLSATGRECDLAPPPPLWDDTPRCTDITKTHLYTETYQYDLLGNMLLWGHSQIQANGSTSTTNRQFTLVAGNNRLSQLSIGSTSYSYSYDAAGNLTQENTERHFEWDQSDRMRVFRAQPSNAPPSLYAQYLYDSAGQRVMKLVRNQSGGYETTIYIDGAFERQRSVTSSATVDSNLLHVMDDQQRIALIRVGDPLPGDGAPDKKIKYHIADHLGSSNVVVDDTGAWISHEEFLPYGETSFGSFARKRYRFNGKERDAESGFYYHGARYYAPWLARWVSYDPAGMIDGLNGYSYVRANPIRLVDPQGRNSEVRPKGSREYSASDLHATGGVNWGSKRRQHTAEAAKQKGVGGGGLEHHHHADIKKASEVKLNPDVAGEAERMSVLHARKDPIVKATVLNEPYIDPKTGKVVVQTTGKDYTHHNAAKLLDKAEQARVPNTPEGLADASATSKQYWPATADYGERAKLSWKQSAPTVTRSQPLHEAPKAPLARTVGGIGSSISSAAKFNLGVVGTVATVTSNTPAGGGQAFNPFEPVHDDPRGRPSESAYFVGLLVYAFGSSPSLPERPASLQEGSYPNLFEEAALNARGLQPAYRHFFLETPSGGNPLSVLMH